MTDQKFKTNFLQLALFRIDSLHQGHYPGMTKV